MSGNELQVVKYLIRNLGKIELNHIGTVLSIGAPKKHQEGYIQIFNETEADLISTTDNKKKADVYINDYGVSVKQEGGSFGFNRLQRKSLESVFRLLNFQNITDKVSKLDQEVTNFHQSSDEKRNVDWSVFFTEEEFYLMSELLMTKYSPTYGISTHPADLILIAPKEIKASTDICVMDFTEYFNLKKNNLKIAIRRSWIGQESETEHARAVSIAKVPENTPWVFNEVSGVPTKGWKQNFPKNDRKTVYYLMIEEEKKRKSSGASANDLKGNKGKLNVISLFSGVGGLDLGFELAGLEVAIGSTRAIESFKDKYLYNSIRYKSVFHTVFANDLFPEAIESYRENMPDHVYINQKDICDIKDFPSANIVLGGFPCPGFSKSGIRLVNDERNFLYIHFIRCVMQVQPEVFIAENVKGMMTAGGGEVFKQIVEDFAAAGYRVKAEVLNARDYGVPQLRERVIIVGIRNDLDFEYFHPEPTHGEFESGLKPFVTLKEAIGDLRGNPGPYFKGLNSTIFMSRNPKKNWNEQSFTIQASGRQAHIHPDGLPMEKVDTNKWIFPDGKENNRRLSVKEISRIQTFPDWYNFRGNLENVYKQIGNAFPILLARAIAKPVAEWAVDYIYKKTDREKIRY